MPDREQYAVSRRTFFGRVGLLAGGALAGSTVTGCVLATAKELTEPPFPRRLAVRPFPNNASWVNTARPIELRDLRGKFVLLDFWTLGCINCMHVIPELRKLEQAWPNGLAVIGVHSAKFAGEKGTKSIADAVRRYKIEHPVVNDADFTIWNSFGVQAWPSLVLVDPEGYAVWAHSGEITFEQVDQLLRNAVPFYRKKGLLDEKPLKFESQSPDATAGPLLFPGKVLADETGGRLFIADSGHNRIVVARFDGSPVAVIGSGASGRADGGYGAAQFNAPQGTALDGETLYVADTENHLIRSVDLRRKQVHTIAGTGRQNRGTPPFAHTETPLRTALSSPWDLWIRRGELYVAMAGVHQIWVMRLDGGSIGVYAGNGREDIVDGPAGARRPGQPGTACFAQPSGLASDDRWLYVADSEGSSIRAVPFDPRNDVRTVVGTAQLPSARLFTFGDVDGRGSSVRLQHPLGVVHHEGTLYVADTYNNKIKAIDPADGNTRTVAGSGKAGPTDDPPAFDQPGGIAAAAGKLFVADTNNHAIRLIDLRKGNRVSTLAIAGL